MKSSLILTVAGIVFLLSGLAIFFMAGGYDYYAFAGGVVSIALGVVFLMARNAPASTARNAIFMGGTLATLGGGLNALYGQWSGTYMGTAVGYIPGVVFLAFAVWFFLAGRANMSSGAS